MEPYNVNVCLGNYHYYYSYSLIIPEHLICQNLVVDVKPRQPQDFNRALLKYCVFVVLFVVGHFSANMLKINVKIIVLSHASP